VTAWLNFRQLLPRVGLVAPLDDAAAGLPGPAATGETTRGEAQREGDCDGADGEDKRIESDAEPLTEATSTTCGRGLHCGWWTEAIKLSPKLSRLTMESRAH